MNPGRQDENPDGLLRQLELQAVLDLSFAISNNQPEEGLFQILDKYLLEKLRIGHFSVFFLESGSWHNAYCHGKMISGWKSLPHPEPSAKPACLKTALPEFQLLNSHIDLLIPFYLRGETGGIILCQRPDIARETEARAIRLFQNLFSLQLLARENQKLISYHHRQETIKKEMEIARQVQKMLFPANLPDSEKLHAYATYLPHGEVSGDYYDFIDLGQGNFAFCVADVSGKGMPAALLMSNFQACLRTLMMDSSDLTGIIPRINRLIAINGQGERFITAFLAVFNARQNILEYANCGHLPPLLIASDGEVTGLSEGSALLGIFDPLPSLRVGKITVSPGSLIAAYTDGLIETEDENEVEFGLDRLRDYFRENRKEKMPVLHQRLLNRLDHFAASGGISDDLTLLTIRFGN